MKIDMEKEKENLNIIALPLDLVVQILLRLPVRSLLRFKTVCKKWLSLISDPKFGKSHCDLAAAPTHRLLLDRTDDEIESFDIKACDYSGFAKLKFPTYRASFFRTVGTCRGLILLTKMLCPSSDLILWNPSTGAHREIPVTYTDWESWYDPSTRVRQGIPPYFTGLFFRFLYGFGYDQSRDDYLLVIIRLGGVCFESEVIKMGPNGLLVCMHFGGLEVKSSRPPIDVLSVKTNVPSFYDDGVENLDFSPGSKCGLFLHKSLHWLAKSKATQLHVVIAFDMVERRLLEIPLSPDLAAELAIHKDCNLRVLGGCLVVCYLSGGDDHEVSRIWVMKDYKVQSSWTKSFELPIHDSDIPFMPLFFTKGGGVVGSDCSGTFKKFNDRGELLGSYPGVLEGGEKFFVIYRESLVTLPLSGDFKEENEDPPQSADIVDLSHIGGLELKEGMEGKS